MYLKKIEIFGFKSFMNKVEVEFGDGLTGVIGPNGCGKSNISDAIRWVLGEQNARLLRGETMDDVIFNGTRSRKPLGMAEVSLTISNATHIFPIDYSEIRVTRRVYRSGVSEYLINKNQCRLKDVKNLFMDTGLGNSSYTLLERTMVDNLLNNTSANLRFMLEEAAGIMKYKTQEKIAVRKLDATEIDLLRIRDIVAEVEKRVRSLKRQIGKADRYNTLTEEIHEFVLHAGLLESRRLRDEENRRTHLREESFRKQESAASRVAGVEAEIEKRRLLLAGREEELHVAQALLNGTENKIEKIQSERLVLEEREKGISHRQGQLENEIHEANERIRETAEARWKKAIDEEKSVAEIRHLESALVEKKEENSQIQDRVGAAKKSLLERKQVTLDLFRGESEKRNEVGNLETRLTHLTERGEKLAAQFDGIENEEKVLSSQAEESGAACDRLLEETRRLRGVRDEAERKLEKMRTERTEVAESLVLMQGKRESLDATLSFLLNLQKEYEGYHDGVRSLLKCDPKPGSLMGVVGELIEVDPPDYLPAFENALGDALQCILVGTEGDALDLLRYLRENESGWATLLPGDRFHGTVPEPSLELLAEEGVIGPAGRFIRAGEGVGDIIRFLLSEIVFVNNLETALRLSMKREYRSCRFVTASGEGAHFPGVIFGGRCGGESVGPYERRSRIAEIEGELKEVSKQISGMIETKRKLEMVFEQCRSDRDEGITSLDRAMENADRVGRERAGLDAALESVRETLQKTRSEKEDVLREAGEIHASLNAVREEFQLIGADGSEADRSLREIEAEMVELEMKREEGNRLLSAARVNFAEAEGRKKSLEAELTSLARWEEELTDEISRKREQLGNGRDSLEEIAERISEISGVESALARQKEEETGARDEILGDVNRVNSKMREMEESARDDRKIKEAFGEEVHGHDMRLQQIALQRENLLERTAEDLGEPLDESTVVEEPPGGMTEDEMRERIQELKDSLRRLGPVNLIALDEFDEENERYEFLKGQEDDLVHARDSLKETIRTVDNRARVLFLETFERVRANFHESFTTLFTGGSADIRMEDSGNPLTSELEIIARPGQKRPQKIALLSGGERALTAIAILFALYQEKPSPFCILDELDAPLDDANVSRFMNMLEGFSEKTQFIMITHNRQTMESVNYLYGVTMEEAGVSRVVSVRLGDRGQSAEDEAKQIEMIESTGA